MFLSMRRSRSDARNRLAKAEKGDYAQGDAFIDGEANTKREGKGIS